LDYDRWLCERCGEHVKDADQLPLNHLRPCVLDENGVPAGKTSSEYNDAESGTSLIPYPSQMFDGPQTHTSIQNLLWQWNSQTMKVTRSTESFSSPGMPLHLVQCFKVFVLSAYCVTSNQNQVALRLNRHSCYFPYRPHLRILRVLGASETARGKYLRNPRGLIDFRIEASARCSLGNGPLFCSREYPTFLSQSQRVPIPFGIANSFLDL
jgi:hypothetical protein